MKLRKAIRDPRSKARAVTEAGCELRPKWANEPARKSPNLNLPGGVIFKTTHLCALQRSCDDHDGDDDDDDNDNDNDDDDDHLLLNASSSISYQHCFVKVKRPSCSKIGADQKAQL